MIPLALPSTEQVIVALSCLTITAIWLIWTIGLVIRRFVGSVLWHGRASFIIYIAFMLIALVTVAFIVRLNVDMRNSRREHTAQFLPALQEGMVLGTFKMPKGTRLELAIANELQSFRSAEFPENVVVAGVQTRKMTRYVSRETDADYKTTGFTSSSLTLIGEGEAVVSGWTCDASRPIVFHTQKDGSLDQFERCTLAAGNGLEGSLVPRGTEVISTGGTVYVDGFTDDDRWRLDIPVDDQIDLNGLILSGVNVYLDAERRLYRVDETELAEEQATGRANLHAGSSIGYHLRQTRLAFPKQWVVKDSATADWKYLFQ